nr:hypothetical protein [Halogeometricum sp. CBA1124]
MTLSDPEAVLPSVGYMLTVSVVVLAVLYWRRGIDRRAAVGCLLLYLPSFVVL